MDLVTTLAASAPAVVDGEIRAYVNSYISALGGTSADDEGRYELGDEAIQCLKQLKLWLKHYDQRLNRLDVARCMAEANLVNGDILEILASLPKDAVKDKAKTRLAIACLEILVPLTWAIDKNDAQMTVNHHRHKDALHNAQAEYKRGILHHETAKILTTVAKFALPSISVPLKERSSRDEGIIRMTLLFLRNVTQITSPPDAQSEENESEISRSDTIEAFHDQHIFQLLLTISSEMGKGDFKNEDVQILEILFYILKGIDVEKLFMAKDQQAMQTTSELKALLRKEATMLRGYARHAPSRHNRFGTMIWMKREDNRVSTLTGQGVLRDDQRGLEKIDKTKTWKKPRGRRKEEDIPQEDFTTPVTITNSATGRLRQFVETFIDSGFNPVFNSIRKAIEREENRILTDTHPRQFFYLISWFLETECMRRKILQEENKARGVEEFPSDSFAIIASVLNQETFIALNRFMQESYDMKSWQDLAAGMKCLTQILLTVQEMAESPLEDDQAIAENHQNRLFYEETTLDRIVQVVRTYSNQGFGYLDAATELAHVHLRMLEHYSKQNVEMQVRSKRRARRKRAKAGATEDADANPYNDDEHGSDVEEVAQAQRTSSERKFDFQRYASKFANQGCVDAFVSFLRYYQDLKPQQLRRAHRFFYRIAFKMDMTVILFRIDIISLFQKMMKGSDALDRTHPGYLEWDELVRQVIKKLVKKLNERPQLYVELLFSKIPATIHYLQYGFEKETAKNTPRPPAQLEIKPTVEENQRIGVAVAALLDQGKVDAVKWIEGVLSSAVDERKGWEGQAAAVQARETGREDTENVTEDATDRPISPSADTSGEVGEANPDVATPAETAGPSIVVKPDSEPRRIAMYKDNRLRLLMRLVGLQRLGLNDDPDATWIVPSSLASGRLQENLDRVREATQNPPVWEDGKEAGDFIRRESAAKPKKAAYDDDSEGDDGFLADEEDPLFPAGGPTSRKSDTLQELKTRRRRRRQGSEEPTEITEEEREARAKARQLSNAEKQRRIKSDLFVHDSDDEDDEDRDREFFVQEEQRRRKASLGLVSAIADMGGSKSGKKGKKRKSGAVEGNGRKKRKSPEVLGLDGAMSTDDEGFDNSSSPPVRDVLCLTDTEAEDTPLSSPHPFPQDKAPMDLQPVRSPSLLPAEVGPFQAEQNKFSGGDVSMRDVDDEDEDVPVMTRTRRPVRGGLVVSSDEDE
ncbi:MAG: Topoisomerase 1-associated factor 1 [Caeruleum heppii]|nr:MAG: Topoisomerase 1-associated factor 1 [Caeruleum heppii]